MIFSTRQISQVPTTIAKIPNFKGLVIPILGYGVHQRTNCNLFVTVILPDLYHITVILEVCWNMKNHCNNLSKIVLYTKNHEFVRRASIGDVTTPRRVVRLKVRKSPWRKLFYLYPFLRYARKSTPGGKFYPQVNRERLRIKSSGVSICSKVKSK